MSKHIAHNLLIRSSLVDVTEESPGGVIRVYLADENAGLVGFGYLAEPLGVPHWLSFLVHLDNGNGIDGWDYP